MALWAAVALLGLAVLGLVLYVLTLRRSLGEIGEQVKEKLETDTNTLLSVSSGDPAVRKLAAELNVQLRALRDERRRLQNGDAELKEAVTNMSHDLRTPLTAISGYLDLLEQEDLPDPAARYFAVIRERADALSALTEELFRYSVVTAASEEPALEDVCLNTVLEESLAAFYGAFTAAGITPLISIPEERVVRRLDRTALRRVFGNVLSNALKYSSGDLSVFLSPEGSVTFGNSAPGLDPVQAQRLFDRFYTVSSARNSTGLGLSIAKFLTQRMGGGIRADYREGKLTIFLDFPCQKNGPDMDRGAKA